MNQREMNIKEMGTWEDMQIYKDTPEIIKTEEKETVGASKEEAHAGNDHQVAEVSDMRKILLTLASLIQILFDHHSADSVSVMATGAMNALSSILMELVKNHQLDI